MPEIPDLPAGIKLDIQDPEALKDPATLEMIQSLIEDLDKNPLQRCFPYPKQLEFLGARVKTKTFLGGNRAGKSSTWVIYVLIQCLPKEAVPPHLLQFKIWNEPIKGRVVTPDYGRTFKSVMEIFEKWTPASQLRGGSWDEGFRDKDKQIFFANGSFIEFLTLEQDVNKFGGSPRHFVAFDEEPKGEKGEEIYRQCAMRLADFRGEEIFAFTPVHGLGWTFDVLWEERGEEVKPEVWKGPNSVLVQASIHDNPFIDPEGKAEALAKLPEKVRAAYESGNFIHFQGLVYEMFDPELHVEEPPTPDQIKEWIQVDGIDPGQQVNANLFAAFEPLPDGNDILHIYDELTLSGTSAIPEHAVPMIFGRRAAWGLPQHPKYRVIDPAVKSRDLGSGERLDAAYRRAGLKMIPANNELEAGVFEVWRRLEHKDADGNPFPLIKISTKCPNLIKEKGKYRLSPKDDGTFGVVKRNDHHCFVAGTLVETRRGSVPIEQITVKDEVLTRQGFFGVEHSGLVDSDAEVWNLEYEGGLLTGTGDHPIYSRGTFQRLDSLRYDATLLASPRPFDTAVTNGGATPGLSVVPNGSTIVRSKAFFIAAFGKITMAPSPRGIRFITSMAIRSITRPRTWKLLLPKHTRPSTSPRSKRRRSESNWRDRRARPLRQRGTALRKVGHGIRSTALRYGRNASSSALLASSVRMTMSPGTQAVFAPITASPRGDGIAALTTRSVSARCATPPSPSTVISAKDLVLPRVLGLSKAGRSAVYNLAVDGPSEYFANGVLVSNCDAMRYIAMTHAPKPKVKQRAKKEAWIPGSAPQARAPAKEFGPLGRFG